MDTAFEKSKVTLEGEFKAKVKFHFEIWKEEYDRYFSDLVNVKLANWKVTRNPFHINENILSDIVQEELFEMKSTAKDDFEAMPLIDFWAKCLPVCKNVGSVAIRTLLPF